MNKRKVKAAIAVTASAAAAAACGMVFADSGFTGYDFENGKVAGTALYGNAEFDVITEDSGNKYLKLTYNGNEGRGRKYCDVYMTPQSFNETDTNVIISYDVNYTETESQNRSGEVQIKKRTGHGSADTTIAARLAKSGEYFMTQGADEGFQRIRDLNGNYLVIEPGKWYKISIAVDLEKRTQSIAIKDRDTNTLLALRDDLELSDDPDYINMVSFSTDTSMCLDNIYVYDSATNPDEKFLYGPSYVSAGGEAQYYMAAWDSFSDILPVPASDTVWTLEKGRTGVSIDEGSGLLSVSDDAIPGMVVIKASRTDGDNVYEARTAVNIID